MITKTILTTSGKQKINIPTDLSEITLGELIDIGQGKLVPGITQEFCDNITNYADLEMIQEYILSLAHKIKYCYETELPRKITISGKTINVIKNLSIEPAGAYLCSRDLIADEINRHIEQFGEDEWKNNFSPSLERCAGLLANYFYCPVTGDLFSEQKAETFKSEILKLKVSEALPIARYFFLRYPNLSKQKISLWRAFKQIWKNAQVRRRLRNSVISISLIVWQMGMYFYGKKL